MAVQVIDDDTYDLMISIAMSLDRRSPPPEPPSTQANGHATGERPGDVYNARVSWADVLEPHGWTWLYRRCDLDYWRRPGKTDPGASATAGLRLDCGRDLLYIFTTNGGPLRDERSYDKFGAYAALNHGGDFQAAGRALLEKGYGEPSRPAGHIKRGGQNGYSRPEETRPPPQKDDLQIYTLPQLLALELPETVWTVPGLLAEGLTLLAGKPKLGKSMLALNLAMTVAAGGKALASIGTTAGNVLYLSLEDRWRRLKFRAEKMLARLGVAASENLEIATHWPRQGDGAFEQIDKWLKRSPHPALIIVDVWQKFRPAVQAGSAYEQDYNHASALKDVGDRAGCSILALHHCKKAKSDDVVDEISGTLGLAGAADGLIVLSRARNENGAELFVSGRDTEERRLAIEFAPDSFVWSYLGEAAEQTESKLKAALIALFKANTGAILSTGEIAAHLKIAPDNQNGMRVYLLRMAGEGLIEKVGVGRYRWPVQDTED